MGFSDLFGKKNKEEGCSCGCGCGCGEAKPEMDQTACHCDDDDVCHVKVLGAGCKSCHDLYENVMNAVKDFDFKVDVEYITDMKKVMEYGVTAMPAIVIDGKVVSMGKVLKEKEIIEMISAEMGQN